MTVNPRQSFKLKLCVWIMLISAAVFVTIFLVCLKYATEEVTEKQPARIASVLNNAIAENNEQNMFVTMFIGKANLATGEMYFCNCGHNAPVTNGDIKDSKTMRTEPCGQARYINKIPVNIPIGVFPGFDYQEVKMTIVPGIKLFLYTDGVTEAENKDLELFGDDRLLDVITSVGHEGGAEETVKAVTDAVHRFADGHEQSDDITTLCFCYRQQQGN